MRGDGALGRLAAVDDALRAAEDASDEAQLRRAYLDPDEQRLAERMVGRSLQARSAVAVRCAWGLPAVLRADARTRDGKPFPTLFWLACPLANRHVGRLEGEGLMRDLSDRLERDEDFRADYEEAARRFVAVRDELGGAIEGDPTAGGMPSRVKCLHSLYAHHLATGGNPVGRWVAERIEPFACPAPCVADQRAAGGETPSMGRDAAGDEVASTGRAPVADRGGARA